MPDDEELNEEDELERRFREIEERTAALREHHASEAHIGDDTDSAISDIERRAAELKATQQKKAQVQSEQRKVEADTSRGLGIGMTVAYVIVGVPLTGALVGWLIDKATKASIYTGIGTLLGAVIGIAMTIAIINRENNRKP